MTAAQAVLNDALQLSQDDREWIVVELAASIEKHPNYDEAWREELARKWQGVLDGTAVRYDAEDADALMFDPLDDE